MTCIVALKDQENGITYMGGDSCASCNNLKQLIEQRKVFKSQDSNKMIMGFSGSVRDLNLLTYAKNLIDKRDEPNIDHKYMVTHFIPNIMKLFKNGERNGVYNNISEIESYFLIAYKDKLWTIEGNYSVFENMSNYTAIGSGVYYALGSLETTKDMDMSPIEKIHKALQVASTFAPGVAPPFYIINTDNDNIKEFKD